MTIYKGNKETLTATFNPTTTSSNEITWTSSNPSVVSVDSSKTINKKVTITAKKAGTATITATHKYGKKATCKVTVINKPLTTVLNGHKVTLANGNDRVYFLDVIGKYDKGKQWQGSDAIVLESNGKYAMIDTGVAPTRGIVVRYLRSIGAKQLEFMLITHAHYDHIAGGVAIFDNGIKVKKLYIKDISRGKSDKDFKERANELIKLARKKGTQICNIASGKYKTEVLGDFKFNFYNTTNLATKSGFDENLNSIATLATINGKKIYFTGDLAESSSLKLETNVAKAVGKIDFYKVAHHSYDWSNKTSALKILNPTYGVVTNGRNRKSTSQARKRILNNTNINESRLWYVAEGTVILTIQQNGVFKIQQLSPDN